VDTYKFPIQFIVNFKVFRLWGVGMGYLNATRDIIEAEIAQGNRSQKRSPPQIDLDWILHLLDRAVKYVGMNLTAVVPQKI
jgi:hypothetical protein